MTTDKLVRESRKAQGLPPKVTDLGAVARIVALLLMRGEKDAPK